MKKNKGFFILRSGDGFSVYSIANDKISKYADYDDLNKLEQVKRNLSVAIRQAKIVLEGVHKKRGVVLISGYILNSLPTIGDVDKSSYLWGSLLVWISGENRKRRSVVMYESEWEELDKIARELDAFSERGPSVGKPSWSALVRGIAQKRWKVVPIDEK